MKRFAPFAIMAAFVVVAVTAILIRSGSPEADSNPRAQAVKPKARRPAYSPPRDPGPPAAPEAIQQANRTAQLRTTYRNFRSAVASGNEAMKGSLKDILHKDYDLARQISDEDVARSTRPVDREIALKTAEALRR